MSIALLALLLASTKPGCPDGITRIGYAHRTAYAITLFGWYFSDSITITEHPAAPSEFRLQDFVSIYRHRREYDCPAVTSAEIKAWKRKEKEQKR